MYILTVVNSREQAILTAKRPTKKECIALGNKAMDTILNADGFDVHKLETLK